MSAELLDGRKTSAKIHEEVREKVARLKAEHQVVPGLATVLVGGGSGLTKLRQYEGEAV